MAKLNLDSVLEALILAAGVPLCVVRTVADQTSSTAQPEERMKKVTVGVCRGITPTQEGNRDEQS